MFWRHSFQVLFCTMCHFPETSLTKIASPQIHVGHAVWTSMVSSREYSFQGSPRNGSRLALCTRRLISRMSDAVSDCPGFALVATGVCESVQLAKSKNRGTIRSNI